MLEHILDGGVIMIPLLGLSILAVAVIIERIGAFRIAAADIKGMRSRVIEAVEKGELDNGIKECRRHEGPVAALLMAGLLKFRKLMACDGMPLNEVRQDVSETMTDYAPHVVDLLEKRLNLLTLVAGVSPLLGMTGTVTGMIKSFASMSSGSMDAAAVGVGISEALVTTAAGLLVAIPSVVAYNIFTRKIDRCTLDMEESATELMETIKLGYSEQG